MGMAGLAGGCRVKGEGGTSDVPFWRGRQMLLARVGFAGSPNRSLRSKIACSLCFVRSRTACFPVVHPTYSCSIFLVRSESVHQLQFALPIQHVPESVVRVVVCRLGSAAFG